jgi:signal transduction histidine kinase
LVAAGECVDEEARELILGLHDVSTAVSLVTRNAEVVIDGYPGETDYEKIENSPAHIKRLLKSVSLLRTRLSMSSIVANPDSASFGEKHPIPVYKVFDRMVRLFEEIAAQKGVHIQIVGPSFAKPDCYDSFDTLALVLIDNAVKYSFGRHHIKVVVKDKSRDAVKVRVESYGPIVPRDMREQIFKRGVRTRVAEESCSKGSGLGLYIARVVASAHGFGVEYKAIEGDRSSSEGWNVFSFEL